MPELILDQYNNLLTMVYTLTDYICSESVTVVSGIGKRKKILA